MLLHTPGWQEVGPDVDRLVVHLEAAEDAVQRWAPRVTVSRDDAILPEHLRTNQTVQVSNYTVQKSVDPRGEKFTPHLLPSKERSEGSIPGACRECAGPYLLEFMTSHHYFFLYKTTFPCLILIPSLFGWWPLKMKHSLLAVPRDRLHVRVLRSSTIYCLFE